MENKNVYTESMQRIKYVFDNFDNVYVSFSGGKDSGLLLSLCVKYIRDLAPNRKLGVFHIDYEAQYQMTTDYVDSVFSSNQDILEYYRICLPISAQCCTSAYQDHWVPWEKEKKDLWVRPMPENCINEDNHNFDFFKKEMWDYDLQEQFSLWLHNKKHAKKTACLVGIRTQESLNRWRAIHSDKNINKYKGLDWSKKMYRNVYNMYPIYDWLAEDIWTANAKFGFEYNKLYDLFYQAGLSLGQMRCASPFNDAAPASLKYYKVIDPNNWGRMIGRVNGVNFTGLYGGTTAMGWRNIVLPKGHTWKSYMDFLLSTLPEKAAENYKKKLEISQVFWRKKGGVLSKRLIKKLKKMKIPITVGKKTNYDTDKLPVQMEYLDDINIVEFREIPTYKRMCICIMKNDHLCKFMGFSLTKGETERRSAAENNYKNIYK
jgi:predicted phosphoadenosine phosphosulfate sulfurtransferase